ncbi:hypothetical protein MRB53_039125 [Persea americana]|nr:hypothetical protein MRB53_039125 [Persea americana]
MSRAVGAARVALDRRDSRTPVAHIAQILRRRMMRSKGDPVGEAMANLVKCYAAVGIEKSLPGVSRPALELVSAIGLGLSVIVAVGIIWAALQRELHSPDGLRELNLLMRHCSIGAERVCRALVRPVEFSEWNTDDNTSSACLWLCLDNQGPQAAEPEEMQRDGPFQVALARVRPDMND